MPRHPDWPSSRTRSTTDEYWNRHQAPCRAWDSRTKTIDDYEKLMQIGEGTFGKVYKARCKATGELVALKKVRMESEKEGFPVTAIREIKLLTRIRHKNIIRLLDLALSRSGVYLVFEYMEYDLSALILHGSVRFEIGQAKCLLKQLLVAICYLHDRDIIHRDIKGSNVLLNRRGELKLADFGLAKGLVHYSTSRATNRVITLWYRPPELLLGSFNYGKEVDVWGVGCLFLEWVFGDPIFHGTDELSQLQSIYAICGTPTIDTCPTLFACPWSSWIQSKEIRPNILSSCIREKSVLSDAGIDLVSKMLELEPSRRVSAPQLLAHEFFMQNPLPCSPSELPAGPEELHEYKVKQQKKQ